MTSPEPAPAPGAVPPPPPGAQSGPQPSPQSGPQPAAPEQPTWYASASGPQGSPRPARTVAPGVVTGVILVVIGAAVLLERLLERQLGTPSWPAWIIIPGIAMLLGSLVIPPRGGLGLAIPGTIMAIVGGILWVQDAYGLYATWAYAWALVAPTGPGVAMLVYGAAQRDGDLVRDGFRTTLTGLALFAGFALFFEGVVGISGHPIANLGEILPFVLIFLGAIQVVLAFTGKGRRRERGRA